MTVLETNYDRVETEKFYKEIETKKIEVPDNLVDILRALSMYCDNQTLSNDGCTGCLFYEHDCKKRELSMCIFANKGYGIPHEWAVYKDEEGGDVDA